MSTTTSPQDKKWLAWSLVLLLTLIWGSSFFLVKKALVIYDPYEIFAFRAFVAAVILLPFSLRALPKIEKQKWGPMLAFAVTATILPTFFYALSQTGISSSMAAILTTLTPLMTLVVGSLFFKQKVWRSQWWGLSLGFVATLYLVLGDTPGALGTINVFALIALLAVVCNGFSGNILKFQVPNLPSAQIAGVAFLIAAIPATYILVDHQIIEKVLSSPEAIRAAGYLAILGLFANALAIILFSMLVKLRGPVFGSLITYLIPIQAMMLGWWDGERISLLALLATVVIIFSIYLVNQRQA